MASDFSIRHAARIIRNGGIIAYPTDTIYGLGCDPYNEHAITRLNDIKQRSANKQFILLVGHLDQIAPLSSLNEEQKKTITQTSEPTSWVIDANKDIPPWLNNVAGTITIRLSKQPDAQRLCRALGHAIISTSANLSDKTPVKNALQLHQRFHFTLDRILASNEALTAKPSKIIRLCDNHIIRQ